MSPATPSVVNAPKEIIRACLSMARRCRGGTSVLANSAPHTAPGAASAWQIHPDVASRADLLRGSDAA